MTQPFHRLSFGSLHAAVWRNEGEAGAVRFNVTLERSYRDHSGKWASTQTFGRDDLLLLAKLVDESHSFILTQQQIERERAKAHAAAEPAHQNER